MDIKILNEEELRLLPSIMEKRRNFRKIINLSVRNFDKTFSNALLIQGKPGSGKTTMVMQYLELLKEDNVIANYLRAAGHVTPGSLYNFLKETSTPNKDNKTNVLVLDDVDCLKNEGCLELLKAAYDTKSDATTNRYVYYTDKKTKGFKYKGFGIFITNDDIQNEPRSIHQEALLDRVQLFNIDMNKEDMSIYNAYLLEDYLKNNDDNLKDEDIKNIVDLYNNEIRNWSATNAYTKAGINFSIRLIKKFIDSSRLFGNSWKDYNSAYKKLEEASRSG